jgi:hypothetical protein
MPDEISIDLPLPRHLVHRRPADPGPGQPPGLRWVPVPDLPPVPSEFTVPDGFLVPDGLPTPDRPADPAPDRLPTRVPVPESAPPYDDELWMYQYAPVRPPGLPRPATAPPLTGPPPARAMAAGSAPGNSPAPDGEAGDWPSRFAQVLAETLAGARPAQQIVPWTTEQARRRLRRLGPQLSQAGPVSQAGRAHSSGATRPVVRRVLSSSPAPGVIEVAAVVSFGPRVRALAIRLEQQPGPARSPATRWRCTTVEAA